MNISPFMFPVFSCFIIFIVWFAYERKKGEKTERENEEQFWKTEHDANFTRRKNLDRLDYIEIPFDTLPVGKYPDNPSIAELEDTLFSLKGKRILNLTGKTSTELKLEYGAANLYVVNEYDENYTLLVRTLQQYADALFAEGHEDEGAAVLEYAVSIGSDIKATYVYLGNYYHKMVMDDKIEYLISQAEKLDSLMKKPIIEALKELMTENNLNG